MLRNIARALKAGGRIGIVEFKKDGRGPGPPMDERMDPEPIIRDAEAAGLQSSVPGDVPPISIHARVHPPMTLGLRFFAVSEPGVCSLVRGDSRLPRALTGGPGVQEKPWFSFKEFLKNSS